MSYRPITDVWILARPKVPYYGAFPAGFLSRARALLGVSPSGVVLHVCAGRVRDYPFAGLGPFDRTVDLDPDTRPDYLMDVRDGLPCRFHPPGSLAVGICDDGRSCGHWDAILIDRPYTEADAAKYQPGEGSLPPLNALVRRALEAVDIGRRVGVLDYQWPHPGAIGKEVAVVAVGTGRNGRARWFTVFERIAP